MRSQCEALGLSRQAYYQALKRQRIADIHEQDVLAFIQHQRLAHPRMGTRKLQYLLAQAQLQMGRDALFELLGAKRLLVRSKRAYHKTTQSHHRFDRHPNLLKSVDGNLLGIKVAKRPEQVWVADITYIPVRQGEAS